MGKKKAQKYDRLWTFFSSFVSNRVLFPKSTQTNYSLGFSFLEVLIVFFFALIFAGLYLKTISPSNQKNIEKDTRIKRDLVEIKNALEFYYSDHGYYPASLAFGNEFSEETTIYMKKLPQGSVESYIYQVDNTLAGGPQWAVLYAKLVKASPTDCLLADKCRPLNYNKYRCLPVGNIDCRVVENYSLP